MEELIRAADIDATIVRLPALTEGPRTGRYRTGTGVPIPITGSIRRADVADFLLGAAITGSYRSQTPRIIASAGRRGLRSPAGVAPCPVARAPLTGRVALVTGATGGMGVVSYGAAGGARAAEHLRLIAGELQMADVRTNVALSLFTDFEDFTELAPAAYQTHDCIGANHRLYRAARRWLAAGCG